MKNNTFFKLFLIFIIALLFRFWCLDKPEGLWNDEYVSWYIAQNKDFNNFLTEMLRNCHTPLYYFYLKVWMFFFKDTDISLRISSVIPSLISVITMFFAGKELKNTQLGIFTALLTAISSFNIYFAQEVRLYSLLFLFSSLTLLFFIRTVKKQSQINFILYFTANAAICALHTLGIIFSFFNIIGLLYILYKYNDEYKNKLKKFISLIKYILPYLVVIALISPFLITIATSHSLSQFWSDFSFSKILFNFVDYFSPIQTNIVNSPDTISTYIIQKNKINSIFIIFALIPTTIMLIFLVQAIKEKNKIINILLFTSLCFFVALTIFSLIGKMILITKYSSEIYPILILSSAFGALNLKKEYLKRILIFTFIFLNLFYLLNSNDAAPRRTRSEGHLAVVQLLETSRLKEGENVLLTYYDSDKFERYLTSKNQYKFYSINKFNFNYSMFNNENYFETIQYGKTIYKNSLKEFPNKEIEKYIKDNFTSKMKKGDRIGIVFLNTVSFLSNDKIQNILEDDKEYKRTPFIFLAFSSLKNSILYSLKDDYKMDSFTQAGDWTLFVYIKK